MGKTGVRQGIARPEKKTSYKDISHGRFMEEREKQGVWQ
jgi:hypothetical protein